MREPTTTFAGDDRLIVGDVVNLWRRDGIEASNGDPIRALEFAYRLIPDEASREHILDYFAFALQNPGRKIRHGIMLSGPQGVGKSFLL